MQGCPDAAHITLKAKSPGSSPGNATKIPNKINGLKASAESPSFAVFVLVALLSCSAWCEIHWCRLRSV